MFSRALPPIAAALVALAVAPATARAQAFGLGPRFSFVRGDLTSGTPSTRFVGGTLRLQSSRHLVIEAGIDFRKDAIDTHTQVRQRPLQASLLLFPVRSRFAPYLLGGFGIYTQYTDSLDAAGAVASTTSERKTGGHLGAGAELFLTKHTALYADYRFRFVKFGTPDPGAELIHIPGASSIPGLQGLQLSHRGSMWTSGMAFYF